MPRRTDTAEHPAPFSEAVLATMIDLAEEEALRNRVRGLSILDPFAGVGKIHALQEFGHRTVGLEIEAEWANQHPANICVDLFQWRTRRLFDAIFTSPVFPNRMTDHHNARDNSHRRTYKHYLGRDPSEDSSATFAWGEQYRQFHARFLAWCDQRVKPGGLIAINMKNHRKKVNNEYVEFHVVEWWTQIMLDLWSMHSVIPVSTPGYRFGKNRESRAESEFVIVCRKA